MLTQNKVLIFIVQGDLIRRVSLGGDPQHACLAALDSRRQGGRPQQCFVEVYLRAINVSVDREKLARPAEDSRTSPERQPERQNANQVSRFQHVRSLLLRIRHRSCLGD